jgi:hypothetical protein
MHDITRDFLVSLSAFATLFGIVYVIVITRHRERVLMLEKGVDASLLTPKNDGVSYTLKIGMLCVGIACGILMGNLLYRNDLLEKVPSYFSMTFLFGGLSLILNNVVERSRQH